MNFKEAQMRTKSPCFGCENRTVGCHSTCEGYNTFRNNADAEKESITRQKMEKWDIACASREGYKRMRTRRAPAT